MASPSHNGSETRRRIAAIVNRQDGPISRRQLLGAGLSHSAIDGRLSRGALFPVYVGVYKLSPASLSRRGQLWAALLALPGPGLISHGWAAWLWGIEDIGGRITLTVARRCQALPDSRIKIYRRGVGREDRSRRQGLPCTSVERTVIDLAPLGAKRAQRAFEEADRLDLLDAARMRAACDRAKGRPGIVRVRRLMEEWDRDRPTKRHLEGDFLDLCREHELPTPILNTYIAGWEVDAFWSDAKLAVEVDSYEYHGKDRSQFDRDREKGLGIAAAGIELIRLGDRDINHRRSKTAAILRRKLAA